MVMAGFSDTSAITPPLAICARRAVVCDTARTPSSPAAPMRPLPSPPRTPPLIPPPALPVPLPYPPTLPRPLRLPPPALAALLGRSAPSASGASGVGGPPITARPGASALPPQQPPPPLIACGGVVMSTTAPPPPAIMAALIAAAAAGSPLPAAQPASPPRLSLLSATPVLSPPPSQFGRRYSLHGGHLLWGIRHHILFAFSRHLIHPFSVSLPPLPSPFDARHTSFGIALRTQQCGCANTSRRWLRAGALAGYPGRDTRLRAEGINPSRPAGGRAARACGLRHARQ